MFDSAKLNDVKKYKLDIFIILFILLLSVLFLVINSVGAYKNSDSVIITVNGSIYGQYPLNINNEIAVSTEFGCNTVIIDNNSVYVSNATCKEGLCVNEGRISKTNQSVICMPNRLCISISNNTKEALDGYSY